MVEPFDKVDFAEDCFAGEVGREVVDGGHRVPVVLCDAVESSVVSARPPASPGFGSYV